MAFFEQLISQWMEEFGRSIEMFTGEKPSLELATPPPKISESVVTGLTWWKQVAKAESAFSIWAGSTEPVWTALEGQNTFFEILSQANQATVASFSAGFSVPFRCEPGIIEPPVPTAQLEAAQVKVNVRGIDAGVVVLLFDKAALEILAPDPERASVVAVGREEWSGSLASPAMFSRLMHLQLPVSVLLGRANITIKEALKLVSGSVVELDRQVGDQVEVMVHGTIVAKGEIVSVKGNYGVRIKEVISRQDRIALKDAA